MICKNVTLTQVQIMILSYLSCLVLCDLVLGVLLAVLALAVCAACLGNVDLKRRCVSICAAVSFVIHMSAEIFKSRFCA